MTCRWPILAVFLMGGCAELMPVAPPQSTPVQTTVAEVPVARPPVQTARTVDQFDTTTAADRATVITAAQTAQAEVALGRTIASLGDPTDPGFWLKTPLVEDVRPGRIAYPANGKTVVVELRPLDAPNTAGSQISLPAMRVIEAPLTGLPEIEVFGR
ncbi:hypothetical protein [Pseudaestuariivita rosea]|uniref:hypothetical protein n=1 Tax=Pseudaestuariivita rosea TaxID=2763263 RepID=UPI001F2FC714|nr:hypothetical protein [Pseudaestuariivita rosea]